MGLCVYFYNIACKMFCLWFCFLEDHPNVRINILQNISRVLVLVDQLLALCSNHSKAKRMQIFKQRKHCIPVTTFYSLSLSLRNNTQTFADWYTSHKFNIFILFIRSLYMHIWKSSSQMMNGITVRKYLLISSPNVTPVPGTSLELNKYLLITKELGFYAVLCRCPQRASFQGIILFPSFQLHHL